MSKSTKGNTPRGFRNSILVNAVQDQHGVDITNVLSIVDSVVENLPKGAISASGTTNPNEGAGRPRGANVFTSVEKKAIFSMKSNNGGRMPYGGMDKLRKQINRDRTVGKRFNKKTFTSSLYQLCATQSEVNA